MSTYSYSVLKFLT